MHFSGSCMHFSCPMTSEPMDFEFKILVTFQRKNVVKNHNSSIMVFHRLSMETAMGFPCITVAFAHTCTCQVLWNQNLWIWIHKSGVFNQLAQGNCVNWYVVKHHNMSTMIFHRLSMETAMKFMGISYMWIVLQHIPWISTILTSALKALLIFHDWATVSTN